MNFDSLPYECDLAPLDGFSKSDLPADLLDTYNGLFGREESYDLQNPQYFSMPIGDRMSTMYATGPVQSSPSQYDLCHATSYDTSNNTSATCTPAPLESSSDLYHTTSYDVHAPQYLTDGDSCSQDAWSPELVSDTWSSEGQLDLDHRLQGAFEPAFSSTSQGSIGSSPPADACTPVRLWGEDSNHSCEEILSDSSSITSQPPSQRKRPSRPLREMTDEEKYQHIRQLNRKTSLEYRNRCKDKMTKLEEQMKHLEVDNRRLEEKAEKLEGLRDQMKEFFYDFVRTKMVNS